MPVDPRDRLGSTSRSCRPPSARRAPAARGRRGGGSASCWPPTAPGCATRAGGAAARSGAAPRGRRRPAAARHAASVAPSSIAWAAPWAMNGSIAWHASPSSVTRPADQRSSGGRSNSAQMKVSSTAPRIVADLRVPALERGERVRDVAAVGPRLARPAVLLDDRDEVDQPLAAARSSARSAGRAHPYLRVTSSSRWREPLGRHQPAIRDAAGEARAPAGPNRHPAHRRVDAVGADQHVDLDRRRRSRTRASTRSPWSTSPVSRWPRCRRSGGQRPQQRVQQVGAVHLVVREAEGLDDRVAERRAQQRPAVVPAALMPGQRPDAHPARSSASPRRCRTRDAFGLTWMPAPTSLSAPARS